jgi:hypothetical protein
MGRSCELSAFALQQYLSLQNDIFHLAVRLLKA